MQLKQSFANPLRDVAMPQNHTKAHGFIDSIGSFLHQSQR
jgi:hypothetical protein